MTRPRILALDLSLVATGWCLPDGTTGRIDGAKLRGMERIDHIVRQVQALARGVDLVAIEGYSYASPNQAHQIGELGGGVRLLLYRLRVPFVAVPPATLKKFATGSGAAKKTAMVVAARERFGLTTTTDYNECDAYLLWAMARHAYGAPLVDLPQVQTAALSKVVWPEFGEDAA